VGTVWWVLGIVVLGATLLDVFLTALNYDESGFLSGRLARRQWQLTRTFTRRLSRRWRPLALRQVTGLQIIAGVLLWIFGTVLGYGLIYYGLMTPNAFSVSGTGAGRNLFSAMYFSAAQLATVGGSSLTAETDLLRFLSIAESLTGVILISLILTFLLGVYSVIDDLNQLCTPFATAERGAGSAVTTLRPYLRDGQADGLDGHLDSISDALSSYTDGVRLHHSAYYFQSGRDRFALPYALRMIAGTLGALRWGLPTGHPGATVPALAPLEFQFLEFGQYLQDTVRWKSTGTAPGVLDAETFARIARGTPRSGEHDRWVAQFVRMEHELAPLVGADPLADIDDAYRRYSSWLPFAYRADEITNGVSRDLDYQPVIVSSTPVSLLDERNPVALRNVEGYLTDPARQPEPAPEHGARNGGAARRLARRISVSDPGYTRLRSAAQALLAAVAAALTTYLLLRATRSDVDLRPVIFGGFVAMLGSGLMVDRTTRARRGTQLLLFVPVAAVVALGALAARSHVWTGVLAVVVAAGGAWAARFGPRWAALGSSTFMVFYYALLMRLQADDIVMYLVGAAVGVAWAYLLVQVLLPERPDRVLRAGLAAFRREVGGCLDVLIDAVSWGRWDSDIARRVAVAMRELDRGSAFLAGRLTGDATSDSRTAAALRLHAFSTTVATTHLVDAAQAVTGATMSLELRGRLAGRLELLEAHSVQQDAAGTSMPAGSRAVPWSSDPPSPDWPQPARAMHAATNELHSALEALSRTAAGDTTGMDELDQRDAPDEVAAPARPAPPSRNVLTPSTRRAVQLALAVGVGVVIGDLVSGTHQYWAMFAAFTVLGGSSGETFVKAWQRVLGTVAGALVGFGLAIATGGDPAVMLPLLGLAVFASTYFRPVSTALQTFFTMTIFAVIYEFLGRLTTLTVEVRVLETVLGALAAVVIAAVVLPLRTHALVDRDLAQLVRDMRPLMDAALARLEGTDTTPATPMNNQLLVVDQDMHKLEKTSAPLRGSAGSLVAGDVDARLTAVWSLTYDLRFLVRAVAQTTTPRAGLDPQDWAALRGSVDDSLEALQAVLEHRSPPAVQPGFGLTVDDDPAAPPATPEVAILRRLERIQQTLVVLVGDLDPGAVRPVDETAEAAT